MNILKINNENLQDAIYLYLGMYDPLNGFMNEDDYLKVVSSMRLNDGSIWTLPITLDVSLNEFVQNTVPNNIEALIGEISRKLKTEYEYFSIEQSKEAKVRGHPLCLVPVIHYLLFY